ncbi:hypothetical protein [Mucilaginibacter sp.]|uniref:hypothetical protein n=1 Tax=Mucilaginibacter sp. TaxID=1882438 RepID=UPI0035BC2E8A
MIKPEKKDCWLWWQNRRLKYNKGLVVAGVLAFLAYCIVGEIFIAPNEEFEVTLFTIAFQGVGYLLMILIANVFYSLGYIADTWFNPQSAESFRVKLYNIGYWFSFALPFSIPILVIYLFTLKYH